MKRFFALFAALCLLLCFIPAETQAAAPAPNPVMRIGLYAGNNALIAANLQNHTGEGYIFGYLDGDRQFQAIAETGETKITMVKNRNVYIDSAANYRDTSFDGATLLGAFHDEIGTYPTYEEAAGKVTALRADKKPAFVSYVSGKWHVRSGSYADSGGGTRVSGSKYCVSVVRTGTNDIIFQFDGGESRWLAVQGRPVGGKKPITYFKGYRYNGTFEYRRMDGNNITVVNAVEMQDYLKGILPYEMSASWPLEALKAQAVSAKSFALANRGKHSSGGYDLCPTTCCQVYNGTAAANEHSDRAVDETYGYYLTHNGTVCNTVYHSSNGGATENSENVWVSTVPYLRGVVDPYEDLEKASYGSWSYVYTNSQLTTFMRERGYPNSGIVNFYVEKYTEMGNVHTIALIDSSGKKMTFSKESARLLFNSSSLGITRSLRYTVNSGNSSLTAVSDTSRKSIQSGEGVYVIGEDGQPKLLPSSGSVRIISGDGTVTGPPVVENNAGTYRVVGSGWGHNVGMSQWGARGMAERGFTFDQILKHYFTGTEITSVIENG